MSFCIKFKLLGTYFVPEISDIAEDQPGERTIQFHGPASTQQQKDPDRHPS
jgi:hypothetical protein